MMKKTCNFSVRLHKTDTWTATGVTANNVSGELGFLHRHQALFMITPYRLTVDRIDYGDFTAITWEPSFLFLFRHPKTSTIGSQYFVPFAGSVWMCIMVTLSSFSLVMVIHLRMNRRLESVEDGSFFGISLWFLGTLFQQYGSEWPSLNSSRFLLLSVVLMAYLSFQYYCTFIIGSLITESPKTIKTLDDLINSGLEIGTTRAVYTKDLFLAVGDPRMSYVYNELIEKKGNRFEVDEGVKRIQQGSFAFHHDSEALYGVVTNSFNDHEICDLSAVFYFKPFPCGV